MITTSIKHTSVLKPSGAISIENKISLVQRQIWNILLSHATDNLVSKQVHEIPLRLIFAEKGFGLKEYAELREHLAALVTTEVQWNIMQKDKRVWGVSALLASAEINESTGMVEYSYSPHIVSRLIVPNSREALRQAPYAKLSLETQRKFRSKHTQFMYEFLTDAFIARQKQTVTRWIHLDEFQRMCGTEYKTWSNIRDVLIKRPMKELDSHVPFVIRCQSMKAAKRTTHIRFFLTKKK